MMLLCKRSFVVLALVLLVTLIAYDAAPHFSKKRVKVKWDNQSAQTAWSLFYSQRFVFYGGPFRYQNDFDQIRSLIKPGQILLSDLATSYYAATSLPVFIRNVHRHHGRWQASGWQTILDQQVVCNLYKESAFSQFQDFLLKGRSNGLALEQPKFTYILVNKDKYNKSVRSDCLWNGRAMVMDNIVRFSTLTYEGEHLNLYEIDSSSSATTSDREKSSP